MKNRVVATLLLAIMLVSVCTVVLADESDRNSTIRYRNGKAFTLYASPSTEAAEVGTLPSHSVFDVVFFTSIDGTTWACVLLDNGTSGYITSGAKMVAGLRMLVD